MHSTHVLFEGLAQIVCLFEFSVEQRCNLENSHSSLEYMKLEKVPVWLS